MWIVKKTPVHFDGHRGAETPLPKKAFPNDVFARSKTEAYLVGEEGLAMKWDGQSWREIHSGTPDDLMTVIGGAAGGPVWAGGARGVMLRFPRLPLPPDAQLQQ